MDLTWLWYILAGLLILIGVLGAFLPALPGLPVAFAGMLLAGWVGGFKMIGGWTLGVLAALTGLSLLIDLLASVLGAKRFGASRHGLIGAALGALIGLFLGLPGLIFGPFVGAVVGELIHVRNLGRASRIGVATWIGMVVGAAFKIAIAVAMLGVFALALVL
jgi:uncharacterized protein